LAGARDFESHDQTNFAFNIVVYDEREIAFKLSYERTVFERGTAARLADLLRSLLEVIAHAPAAELGMLPRLPSTDTHDLASFSATERAIMEPVCINDAFEAQVDRTPDAVARVFRGESLTYGELDERSNRVAEELAQLGVGADHMVGLFVRWLLLSTLEEVAAQLEERQKHMEILTTSH
jgi:non-ribosomal peptide synthetase component F